MPRALWKGSLAFGLVSIPVELQVAVRDHRPRFTMLHATDRSPVNFTRVCAREGRPVAWNDLVKGYEYAKGRFVVLTRDDFRAAALEHTRRIDIVAFVAASEIDDRYFEMPYYVVPAKGGEHAYALLREAMRAEGRAGIAKFMLRDTQHLAAVEVVGQALVLTLLRFADELTGTGELTLPSDKGLPKAELEMASRLIKSLATSWKPEEYEDDYRNNLMRIIQAKAKGKQIELPAAEEPRQANVVDLMERLRRSLAQRHSKRPVQGRVSVSGSKRRGRKPKKQTAA